eukprot:Nk52_evm61s236 gene=Nk52_evmTU61s236
MGKKQKVGKDRLDKFYYLAKEQGYRSRASFKLIQLNRQFNFLEKCQACIDLCAAPGGWLQVAAKHMPQNSMIVGVDLVPIKAIRNCTTLCEDITTEKCRSALRKELKHMKADCVLNDGAPNVGKNWYHDAFTQSELTLSAFKLACEFLKPGGYFVTKVFRSRDYNALMWVFGQLFKKVHATKPQASRNQSAEIFVVCQGFLAPDKIDPKFFDPKHIFGEVEMPAAKVDLFKQVESKKKAKAVGYDEYTTFVNQLSASTFVNNEEPLDILVNATQIVFEDQESKEFLQHPATTEEIKILCEDLKVLGKRDFKQLLKWRTTMREHMAQVRKNAGIESESEEEKEEEEESMDEDERIDNEIDELETLQQKEKKKEKKKLLKLKTKIRVRMQLNKNVNSEALEYNNGEDTLFDMKNVKTGTDLGKISGPDLSKAYDDGCSDEENDKKFGDISEEESDGETDDEESYLDKIDREMDGMYDEYKRLKNRVKVPKKGKKEKRFGSAEGEEDTSVDALNRPRILQLKGKTPDVSYSVEKLVQPEGEEKAPEGEDEYSEEFEKFQQMKKDKNSLIVDFNNESAASKRAKFFFDQSVFNDLDDEEDEELALKDKLGEKLPTKKSEEEEEEDLSMDFPAPVSQEKTSYVAPDAYESESDTDGDGDFEVVPEDKDEDDISDSSDDEQDPELEVEEGNKRQLDLQGLALAATLAKKRKTFVDDAYNRYTYNDESLPSWFVEEEGKHTQIAIPISKEAVEEAKRRTRELNVRPIKKVAEAKARKKMKSMRKLERLRTQANAVSENSSMSEQEKQSQIEKLYKKASVKKKHEKATVVVASKGQPCKGRPKGVKGRYKIVDKRMRKDLRGEKKAAGGKKRPKRTNRPKTR